MRYKEVKLIAVLLFVLGLTALKAQESVNVAGGQVSGSRGSVSYSVGQAVYLTDTDISGSITEGVQQPYEIYVLTSIEEDISISAYPNPVTDFLQLNIASERLKGLSYELYDMYGKSLQSGEIKENPQKIAIVNFGASIYFVKVVRNNTIVKTFKIIKREIR